VVVDDQIPVYEDDEFIYCSNQKDKNEFFVPLLEKAYAKLNSCYAFTVVVVVVVSSCIFAYY